MSLDRVFIRGLTVEAVIGVCSWEREVRQPLVFDVEMAWDTQLAAKEDDLNQALNYQAVAEFIENEVKAHQPQLLETLVNQLAERLMRQFSIQWLRLKVEKPSVVPHAQAVGVVIERGTL